MESSSTTFVPGFEFDVFVSYAQGDVSAVGDAEYEHDRIAELVDVLKKWLPQALGAKQGVNIWPDRHRRGDESFEKQIIHAISHAATLLVILTESYLQSDWCKNELQIFLKATSGSGGPDGRIFAAYIDNIDRKRLPAPLADLPRHPIYQKTDKDDRPPKKKGKPTVRDPVMGMDYSVLTELAKEMASKLLEMRKTAEGDEPGTPEPRRVTLPVGMERLRLAYLAALDDPASFDLLEHLDPKLLQTKLEQILDAIETPSDARDSIDSLKQRLQEAEPNRLWLAWMASTEPDKLHRSDE